MVVVVVVQCGAVWCGMVWCGGGGGGGGGGGCASFFFPYFNVVFASCRRCALVAKTVARIFLPSARTILLHNSASVSFLDCRCFP